MIDYNNLSEKFSSKLKQFNKVDLEQWIEYDKNRDNFIKLLRGEKVLLTLENKSLYKLTDSRENIESNVNDFTHAMAA